jgi:fructose-bisphosphate aldolase/2-amino-3,7-dideoxy-D-threo-hept-6-ulosonate synthase
MDHAVDGFFPELAEPDSLIASLADVRPNAFLLRRGTAELFSRCFAGKAALIVRVTCATGLRGKVMEQSYTLSVEEAVRIGADAVSPIVFVGSDREPEDLHNLGILTDKCREWGMPLMGEILPVGNAEATPFQGPYTAEDLRAAVRVAGEEGCDFVKTHYTGDPASFSEVTRYSTVPVVVAGGPKADTLEETLRMVDGALRGGAKGVALGRKVWASPNPPATLKALRQIIHEGRNVENVIAELKGIKS